MIHCSRIRVKENIFIQFNAKQRNFRFSFTDNKIIYYLFFVYSPTDKTNEKKERESVANPDWFRAGAEASSDHKVVFFMNKNKR